MRQIRLGSLTIFKGPIPATFAEHKYTIRPKKEGGTTHTTFDHDGRPIVSTAVMFLGKVYHIITDIGHPQSFD